MDNSMVDLSTLMSTRDTTTVGAANSTNKAAGNSNLGTTDFLKLMVAQFQYQTMESTASATDMLNQMVQMSVIQAVSEITTLLNDSTALTYGASLVGKEVTVGQYVNGELKELLGTVTGTGTLGGRQVIFMGDKSYYLSDIMAVGRLPDLDNLKEPESTENGGKPDENTGDTDKTEP